MPANFQRPSGNQFGEYLGELLGSDYNVTYIERRTAKGEVDPTTSFFHITQTKAGGQLATNLKINLGQPSDFTTDYGGRMQRGREYAPEILTRKGTSGYVVGGTWESTYVPVLAQGQKRGWKGRIPDYTVQQTLRSPTESLATLIHTGFEETRQEIQQGNRGANVQSKITNLLAEGSGEKADFSVPAGALLMMPQDRLATRRAAARSIQMVDVYNTGSGIPELEQRSRIQESRIRAIETYESLRPTATGEPEITQLFKQAGYGPDRDNVSRMVPYFQASRNVINAITGVSETQGYLPSEKAAKHRTILETGRQTVSLLGPGMEEIQPTAIPYRGSTSGYRTTTADVGGRIPERSLVLGTLFSPQYPVPGAGMYFPETTGLNVKSAGYFKQPSYPLTENVSDLISGKTAIKLGQETGAEVPSNVKFTYARIKTSQSEDFIDLQERMGSSSFTVGEQQLRIPKYYNKTTGLGAEYDEARIASKELREVTPKDVQELTRRMGGVPIVMDETIDRVFLEQSGFSKVGAKVAISGLKSDIVPYAGSPSFKVAEAGVGERELPVSMLTWETKSMAETMITSLGAMPARSQMEMLNAYARSLRQSEAAAKDAEQARILGAQAEGVKLFMGEVKAARAQDPNARMDIDQLAGGYLQMPAHEVGRDILQRVLLGGRTVEQFGQMTEPELEEFAASKENRRNLIRYGMGYVSSQMTEPITTMWDESQVGVMRESYVTAAMDKEGAASMGISRMRSRKAAEASFYQTYGFDPVNVVEGKRAQTFRPKGFYMPVVSGPVAEFPGGGVLGAEELALVNRLSPGFANRLGVSLTDITSGGALARSLQQNDANFRVRNPARWAQAQAASLAMIETARGTARIDLPESTTITGQAAQRMLDDPEMQKVLGREGANLAGLGRFKELLPTYFPDVKPEDVLRRPIQFEPAKGHYIPSPEAISTMATEDVATMTEQQRTGEDVTRTWDMYQQAFQKGLLGTRRQDAGTVTQGTGRLSRHFMNMFGLPEGGKRQSIKTVLASDVGASKSRYAFWNELKQEEIYGSKELYMSAIRTELTTQGIEPTPEEVEETYKMVAGLPSKVGKTPSYVTEKGVPGMAERFPVVAGEESAWGVNFITPEHLLRSRRNAPADAASGLSNLNWRVGAGLSSIMQGDFDLDMLMALMGLKATRGEKGLQVTMAGFDRRGKIDPDLQRQIERTRKASYPQIQRMLFPSMAMQREFDPFFQAFTDRGPGGVRGVAQRLFQKQFTGGERGGTGAGWYTHEGLIENLKNYAGAKLQMGVTYDFTRALEASSEIGGWTTPQIMQARRSRASLYQPFLDVSTGVPNPMVHMYQTTVLSEGAGGKLGMTWGRPIGRVGEKVEFLPAGATEGELATSNAVRLVQRMLGTAVSPYIRKGKEELVSPRALAWAFSPEGERAFRPEDLTTQEMGARRAEQGRLYDEMVEGYTGPGTPDREERRRAYYQSTSLEEAIQRPFETEGLTTGERAEGMRTATAEWIRANYEDTNRREDIFKAPLIQAMFSKGYAKKLRDEPGWELPARFAPTVEGQGLVGRAQVFQPLFNMMRGRLSPADESIKLMRNLQQRGGTLGNLGTWALGNVQNVLGFGRTRMETELPALYEEAMSSPIQIRASNLPGLAGIGPTYGTQTTTGFVPKEKYGEQALRTAGANILSRTLGIPGARTYDFTGAMFPPGESTQASFEKGNVMEARLGAAMGQEQGWFTVNRYQINPETGKMEAREESDPTRRFQGAFVYKGQLGGEKVEVGATPDFLRMYQNQQGEDVVQFVEQKTPGAGKTRAQIAKESIPGWGLQAKVTPWIVQQLRGQIQAGAAEGAEPEAVAAGREAEESLRSSIGSYIPEKQLQERAYNALMAGRQESQVFVTQAGSKIGEEIMSGEARPERIQAELEEQAKPGFWGKGKGQQVLYQPSTTGQDVGMQEMTQTIGDATRRVAAARPKVFSQLWGMVEAAPGFWHQRRKEYQAAGRPTAGATAALDLMQQVRLQMKAIGGAAEREVAAGQPAQVLPQANFQGVPQ